MVKRLWANRAVRQVNRGWPGKRQWRWQSVLAGGWANSSIKICMDILDVAQIGCGRCENRGRCGKLNTT